MVVYDHIHFLFYLSLATCLEFSAMSVRRSARTPVDDGGVAHPPFGLRRALTLTGTPDDSLPPRHSPLLSPPAPRIFGTLMGKAVPAQTSALPTRSWSRTSAGSPSRTPCSTSDRDSLALFVR